MSWSTIYWHRFSDWHTSLPILIIICLKLSKIFVSGSLNWPKFVSASLLTWTTTPVFFQEWIVLISAGVVLWKSITSILISSLCTWKLRARQPSSKRPFPHHRQSHLRHCWRQFDNNNSVGVFLAEWQKHTCSHGRVFNVEKPASDTFIVT